MYKDTEHYRQIMRRRLPSAAIRRALRGKPLPGRDVLVGKVACARCHGLFSEAGMAYGGVICKDCRAQVEAALVEVIDEQRAGWDEARCKIEDWLYLNEDE